MSPTLHRPIRREPHPSRWPAALLAVLLLATPTVLRAQEAGPDDGAVAVVEPKPKPKPKKRAAAKPKKHAAAPVAQVDPTIKGAAQPPGPPPVPRPDAPSARREEPPRPVVALPQPPATLPASPSPGPSSAAVPAAAVDAAARPAAPSPAQAYCANIADQASQALAAAQAKRLAEAEEQIRERIKELDAKRAEYQQWFARQEEARRKAEDGVVAIFSKMKADAAAQQMAAMEEGTAAAVLARLSPRAAGSILNEMTAAKAARITDAMTRVASASPGH